MPEDAIQAKRDKKEKVPAMLKLHQRSQRNENLPSEERKKLALPFCSKGRLPFLFFLFYLSRHS